MGRIFKTYLESHSVYVCNRCATHVVSTDDIVSKQFQGRHGKAYLFDNVVNISLGTIEERELAQEPAQKYKEGKYIVEKAMVRKATTMHDEAF